MNGHHDALSDDSQSLSSAFTVAHADVMQQLQNLQRSQEALAAQQKRQMQQMEARHQADREERRAERDEWRRERAALEGRIRQLEENSISVGDMNFEGGVYRGLLMNGQPHGSGTLLTPDGRVIYTGDWRHGKRHGYGEEFINGKVTYRGVWVRGEKKGAVVATGMWWEGHFYHGPTLDGRPHGEGELRDHHDKIVYKGQWTSGRGQGEEFDSQGRVIYRGEWADGKRHGRGKALDDAGRATYEGEWTDGKRHGQGKAYYNIGYGPVLWFDGEWREGLANSGMLFPDGTYYGGKHADGTPKGPITPIRWREGEGVPKIVPGVHLHQWLQCRGVSAYLPAAALG